MIMMQRLTFVRGGVASWLLVAVVGGFRSAAGEFTLKMKMARK